jgi:hypothetical protein
LGETFQNGLPEEDAALRGRESGDRNVDGVSEWVRGLRSEGFPDVGYALFDQGKVSIIVTDGREIWGVRG